VARPFCHFDGAPTFCQFDEALTFCHFDGAPTFCHFDGAKATEKSYNKVEQEFSLRVK